MKIKYGALLAFTLSGCAGLPSPEEVASADYGSYPSNYESIVKEYVEDNFNYSDSVKYQGVISTPKKKWLSDGMHSAEYGYLVCATLNGKNLFGKYLGFNPEAFLIHNDTVILYVPKGEFWDTQLCVKEIKKESLVLTKT